MQSSGTTENQTAEYPNFLFPLNLLTLAITDSSKHGSDRAKTEGEPGMAALLYQGHASLRLTTAEGKVIYIDPYAGTGYDLPADLILGALDKSPCYNL